MARSLHMQVKAGTKRLSKAGSAASPGELKGQKESGYEARELQP